MRNRIWRLVALCLIAGMICPCFTACMADLYAKNGEGMRYPGYGEEMPAENAALRGVGTATETVVSIGTGEELIAFAARVNAGETDLCAELTADITILVDEYGNAYNLWTPIGFDADHAYTGTFHGNGYSVEGPSNSNVAERPTYAGLFGYIGSAGVVDDLSVKNANINSCNSDNSENNCVYAGALAGYNAGRLDGIRVENTKGSSVRVRLTSRSVSESVCFDYFVGGIVGYNSGSITNSTLRGSGELSSSSNSNRVGNVSYVGGIAGYNDGSIENCTDRFGGDLTTNSKDNAYVGGIAGYNGANATIGECQNESEGSVSARLSVAEKTAYAGGIAGYNLGVVTNSFNSGIAAIRSEYSGSISKVITCFAGGIVGINETGGRISFCALTGPSEVNAIGSAAGSVSYAGGIAGYNQGRIETCFTGKSGAIAATAEGSSCASYAGGIAGFSAGDDAAIENCYCCTNADLTAITYAGGLVGSNRSGSLQNAYFCGSGTITANSAGGVVGENAGTLLHCYYDNRVCESVTRAIAEGTEEDTAAVCGLTTKQMTGLTAIGFDAMDFTFPEGEESPWIVREPDAAHFFYPHLKGFGYETAQSAEWPPAVDRGTIDPESEDPTVVCEIAAYAELKEFAGRVNAGETNLNARLLADIDAAGAADWIPIGAGAGQAYAGTFDGCGHTITGLNCTIDDSQSVYAGLFGYVGQGGVVKNIGIVNPKINASAVSSDDESAQNTDVFAGAIAGFNAGKIQQCYLSGSGTVRGTGISPCVKNMNINAGALVGKNQGTIQDCYHCGSTAVKAGFQFTYNYNETYNVDSENEIHAGGIVGYNSGLIKNCYYCGEGKITVTQSKRVVSVKETEKKVYSRELLRSYAGAIAGSVSDGSTVENCYYDFRRCSIDRAVGNREFAGCKLTTEDMTKGTYLTEDSQTYVENMPGFLSEIWLVKESESGYYFYPHLKGFAYDAETTAENWPPEVSELESPDPGGDEAALCALTISTNEGLSSSDDAGVSVTDAGKVKIDEIKAGTVLVLLYINDSNDDRFIGWYSNGKLVTDSSAYEWMVSEDVEFEIRCRNENEKIIKFVADLNGEKQIWEIVTYTTNEDISFPKMNFYGFQLEGWKVNGNADHADGGLYTTEEAENEAAIALWNKAATFAVVEGVFRRTKETANSGIPGLDGKYTVTVCMNDVVVERLFRDFAASEYFTFHADEIEKYVDTTGKTFSHWLLDDVKISANREVTFRVAKDCVLNAVYVSDRSSSVKLTEVSTDDADNMKLEAEVHCESGDVIDGVTFRYQVAPKVITGKKDERAYVYTATVSDIDVHETYAIHIQPVVIFNNGLEPMECKKEVVVVDGGTIADPSSHFQYDEESLLTSMNVSIDNETVFLTVAINSESVARILKVRFIYRESMVTQEIAGTKDDFTGKYTATISDIDLDEVYSVQPIVTMNGEEVEGACVEVLPKHGYDGSEKACVDIVDVKTKDGDVIFAEHIFVPAGCIISRAGVLLSIGSDRFSDASVLDTVTDENEKIYNATIQTLSGKIVDERGLTCTHTWTKKNIGENKKVYVLAYLVYVDPFNKQHIVCSVVKNIIL